MKQNRIRAGWAARAALLTAAVVCGSAASSAYADGSGSDDSVIDLIIDWIEDFFDPEPPVEEPPADDNSW